MSEKIKTRFLNFSTRSRNKILLMQCFKFLLVINRNSFLTFPWIKSLKEKFRNTNIKLQFLYYFFFSNFYNSTTNCAANFATRTVFKPPGKISRSLRNFFISTGNYDLSIVALIFFKLPGRISRSSKNFFNTTATSATSFASQFLGKFSQFNALYVLQILISFKIHGKLP